MENYLTEIFSYCIETDLTFRKDFLALLKINNNSGLFHITTQINYENIGRPDIEITFENTAIIIECKVEAGERVNQISDYAKILLTHKKNVRHRYLVLLTKYFEHKEASDIDLYLIRWFEIYSLINERHSQITQQLKQFLKEHDMEKIKNFTVQDLLAMKTIPTTISKMDELLEQFKPVFEKNFGGFSKDASRSTRLINSSYINYVTLNFQKKPYWLLVGFFWYDDIEIPYIGLSIEIPQKTLDNVGFTNILDKELIDKRDWEYEDFGGIHYYNSIRPITEFITHQDDNIPNMKKYVESNLKNLLAIREKYPNFFKK